MEPTNNVSEYLAGAGKLAPSAGVAVSTAAGASLQDWVYIVTIIYTLMMICNLIYKFIKGRS